MSFATKKTAGVKDANNAPKLTVDAMHAMNVKITNVRLVTDTLVCFTINLDGISLYNMKLCEGSKGRFITPPTTKGSDGKYYKQYGLWLDEEAQNWLMEVVLRELEG